MWLAELKSASFLQTNQTGLLCRPAGLNLCSCLPRPYGLGSRMPRLAGALYPSLLFPLCSVPDGADDDSLAAHAVEHNIWSAADDQFADSRLGSGPAQAWMVPESFNHGDDARGQPRRCLRFVLRHVGADFLKPGQRLRRPDDLYRHAGSSCAAPQTHLGSGNSWSVPQERSHAFMSSCRM